MLGLGSATSWRFTTVINSGNDNGKSWWTTHLHMSQFSLSVTEIVIANGWIISNCKTDGWNTQVTYLYINTSNRRVSPTFHMNVFANYTIDRVKTDKMLVPLFLPPLLLLLLEVIIPVTSRLNSVTVIAFNDSKKTLNGPEVCALDAANETTSSSSVNDCSIKCARDVTCTGFNVKNTLTCDHINTPVLASTSRTHSPVITSIHLYWLQHQELTHLWSHQ